MTTISLADWRPSPEIIIGKEEHKRLTVVALTVLGECGDSTDLLLYELDRARLVPDSQLPADVVRIGSVVRYRPIPGDERTVKLVMPEQGQDHEGYRLAVTSEHGAALVGTRPGHRMAWVGADGVVRRLEVIKVANSGPTPPYPDDDPGPRAA